MTLDTLLIPTDGSEPAETAARRGFDLAEALGAAVHVLSVADSAIATGAGYGGDSPSIRRRLRKNADARAASLCEKAETRGLEATAVIREGIPAEEIVAYAADHEVDAILIGTSGRGGLSRAIMGSVADKVVRTASVPVVTITPSAAEADADDIRFDSILLPTDGSEPAEVAIRRGFDLAERLDATVHLLSVIEPALSDSSEVGTDPSDRLRERAGAYLETLAGDAHERGLNAVTATTDGRPASAILEYAETNDIDAIAMGTHGRGGFERLVVGSVTDAVIRNATVPVCTVRPNGLRTEANEIAGDDDSN